MKLDPDNSSTTQLNQRLATSGLRFTAQRQHVYHVLLDKRDHPTAEEVFLRTKEGMPDISIATVYNCLDALVKCNLVRQVKIDRGATRFCPNMQDHGHFFCDECGAVFDIAIHHTDHTCQFLLPDGFQVNHYEFSFHGLCSACSPSAQS